MLGSIFKGVCVIFLGMLLMTSIYVLDRCEFLDHWNPNELRCIQTARGVQRGAIAGLQEFLHGGKPASFREQLRKIRKDVELLPEATSDLAEDTVDSVRTSIDEGRRGVIRWGRAQVDFWLKKL